MKEFLFTNSDIDNLFDNCLSMPIYSRVEFLSLSQKKSGYSEKTFLNLLLSRWRDYRCHVFSEYEEMGFDKVNSEYGFEFCLKVWGDEPEEFEYIYDLDEYENEKLLSSFIKKDHVNLEWLNEEVLFLVRDYIYKLDDFFKEKNPLSITQENSQLKLIQSESDNEKFNSLVNDFFSIDTLTRQIEGISVLKEKSKYIEFVIDRFNMISTSLWLNILEKQNQFNVKFGMSDFNTATGSFGLYIDNPDEIPFDQTALGMKFKMILNDFVRKCDLLILKIKGNNEFTNEIISNQTQTKFTTESVNEGATSLMFKCNEALSYCQNLMSYFVPTFCKTFNNRSLRF